jgi:hypothetical protein
MSELVQLHSMGSHEGLKQTINNLRDKKKTLSYTMKVLNEQMRGEDKLDNKKLTEFLNANAELRKIRIYEAEFLYLKNIL